MERSLSELRYLFEKYPSRERVLLWLSDDKDNPPKALGNEFMTLDKLREDVAGFEPDQVIVASNSEDLDDTVRGRQRLSFGFVDNDGSDTQASHNQVSEDGSATSSVAALAHDNRVLRDISPTTNNGSIEIGNFDADGFSVFTRDAAQANRMAYLALQYTDDDSLEHWVGSMLSPAGIGDWSVTAPGFTPQFVLLLPSMCASNTTSWPGLILAQLSSISSMAMVAPLGIPGKLLIIESSLALFI